MLAASSPDIKGAVVAAGAIEALERAVQTRSSNCGGNGDSDGGSSVQVQAKELYSFLLHGSKDVPAEAACRTLSNITLTNSRWEQVEL